MSAFRQSYCQSVMQTKAHGVTLTKLGLTQLDNLSWNLSDLLVSKHTKLCPSQTILYGQKKEVRISAQTIFILVMRSIHNNHLLLAWCQPLSINVGGRWISKSVSTDIWMRALTSLPRTGRDLGQILQVMHHMRCVWHCLSKSCILTIQTKK